MTLQEQYRQVFNSCTKIIVRNKAVPIRQTLQQLMDFCADDAEADMYGQGELINQFESKVAKLLGKEAAVFMPSGTMAQPIALRIWADLAKSRYVGLPATSHLQLHEHNAFQILYGLLGVTLGAAHKVPDLIAFEKAAADPLAAILLELPMREIGGQLPTWDALVEQSRWARKRGIKLHLDGARLWQCPAAYDRSLAEISDLFDSVYVSFYKDLGGISGAVLAGDKDFIACARVWQRRAGGNLIALYPYVLAAERGLEMHLPNMAKRFEQAKWLAKRLNEVPQLQTWPEVPQTNMFRLRISAKPSDYMSRAVRWMEDNGVGLIPAGYEVGENHIMCELTIGDAFSQQSEEEWQQQLNDFVTTVFGE